MKTTEKGLSLIRTYEGFRAERYRCPAGKYTVGYGHTGNIERVTRAEAEALLRRDVEERERQLDAVLTAELRTNQYDALVSLLFNIGIGNLRRSALLQKINAAPDDPSIRAAWLAWCHADGKRLPGLVRRREAEIELYES